MLRNRDNKRPAYLCQGNAYSVKFSRSFNYSPEKKKSMCLFKDLTCWCVHCVDICRKWFGCGARGRRPLECWPSCVWTSWFLFLGKPCWILVWRYEKRNPTKIFLTQILVLNFFNFFSCNIPNKKWCVNVW